jgi:hypothetical protein
MKTFLEFIAEAELIENDQQELAQLDAKMKFLQQKISAGKGKPEDKDTLEKLGAQRAELMRQVSSSAKVGAKLNKDRPQEPQNKNTITGGGYAQTGKSQHSRIDPDTLPGQKDIVDPRDDAEARSDTISGSRYVKPGSSGGRGTNIGRSGSTLGTKGGNR